MPKSYEPSPEHPLTPACPYFPPEEQAWLQGELREILNARLSMGPRVREFEGKFAAYCGTTFAVAVPSCSAALELGLLAVGVEPGDEVLVPVETFVATGMAVHLVGARPLFTEIDRATLGMDFDDAWARVTPRTRGAIIVHFAGLIPPGLPAFVERMQASGRFVIEDAAHAPGAELNGTRAGSFGDAGCFSFFPTKIMTTAEGGMLVTSRPEVERVARSLQNRGLDLEAGAELYRVPGRNNRVSEIAAAMGLSQLRCLPGFLEQRRRVAKVYDDALVSDDALCPIRPWPGSVSSYWRYPLILDGRIDRKVLKEAAQEDGISIDWPYDPLLHLQPVFRELLGTAPGLCPRSEHLLGRHICLPVHARMRECDAEYLVDRVRRHAARLLNERG